MTIWIVPPELVRGKIPKKVYCNSDLVAPLERAFRNVVGRGLVDQLHTWDGCFSVRRKRGGSSYMSLHSWGVAIDLNAKENCMGHKPKLSPEFVACFTDAGLEWGGKWHTPDGMHFQLSRSP
jgi:hypothetical protein